jgi:hypothetical protein
MSQGVTIHLHPERARTPESQAAHAARNAHHSTVQAIELAIRECRARGYSDAADIVRAALERSLK